MSDNTNKLEDISLILKDFLKVIKVVSMYPEDNPLPQSLKRSFTEKLVSIVEQYGDIKIVVEKDCLYHQQDIVFEDRSKEESLADIFFGSGITNFTFKDGLDIDDVYRLLEIIKDYQNSPQKSLDLVAMIWEAGISRFAFTTIEDISLAEYDGNLDIANLRMGDVEDGHLSRSVAYRPENYSSIFNLDSESQAIELSDDDSTAEKGKLSPRSPGRGGRFASQPGGSAPGAPGSSAEGLSSGDAVQDGTFVQASVYETVFGDENINEIEIGAPEAAQAMGFGDIPSTAIAPQEMTALILNDEFTLSDEEENVIASLVNDDAGFDPYESTLELLKELLHQEKEMNSFYETVTICERILSEFVAAGKILEAGLLLQYMKRFASEIPADKQLWAERIKDAVLTAGGRERLKILADSLNQRQEIGSAVIRQYLDNFDWEALGGIVDLLGKLTHERHRDALCDFLAAKGKTNLQIISRGLFEKRSEVVRNSVTVLTRIDEPSAYEYLEKIITHKDKAVRLELVRGLRESPSDKAVNILIQLARDPDPSVRKEAISSISSRRGRVAFEAITEIINDDSFILVDPDDQLQLLNAFSMLGGELAVPYLSQLVLKFSFLKNSRNAFFRKAAFEALSLNPSERAEKLLVKLSSNWRPDIRTRARDAQYRRRLMIHGGDHDE